MGGGGDGGSKSGGGVELTEAVLTYEGHISDPQLPSKLSHLASCLQSITDSDEWLVRKVEPWNSVKVTFSIPKEAAERLYLLAQSGDTALRQLGILSVQVEGDQVISLKVNGPNNEPAEIILRADDNSNNTNEMLAPPVIPRQVSHSFPVPSIVGGQAVRKTSPIPQFRSSAQGADGNVITVNRQVVGHPRPVQQGINYVEGVIAQRAVQQLPTHGISSPTIQGTPTSRVVSVATRPTFPNNPPPPYPGQDINRDATTVHVPNNASIHKAGPSQVAVTQLITSNTQSNVGNYHTPGHVALPNNANVQTGRNLVRAPMNMVKNSPLLVGLLQSPEQNLPIVKSNKISSLPSPHSNAKVSENSPSSPVHNASIPLAMGRHPRESAATVQQIYPGASAIPNSLPNKLLHTIAASSKPQVLGSNPIQLSTSKTQHNTDIRTISTEGVRYLPVVTSSNPDREIRDGLQNSIKKEDITRSSSHSKKDSQYLINPNTGLLEPRPSTDSSDSEAEGKGSSPGNNSIPSDDESSNSSKMEQDIAQAKMPSHKEKERETGSWHNSLINTGEKIKLKLKLGREPCSQTTIVGNKKVEKRRDTTLQVMTEPRVPKLHIKLHSSQPVIVKSVQDSSISVSSDDSKKLRKKLSRNKLRDDDLHLKLNKHKDTKNNDDINARFLRLSESKRLRDADHDGEGQTKMPKLCDDSNITISKTSRTDKARKTRKPVRKVGDLNSLGEIASHKIMETLPPSITKVADLHTQSQQNSLSPSISTLFVPATRDHFGADVKLESKDKDTMNSNLSSIEPRDHPLVVATSKTGSFLSNGDICLGSPINKTVLNAAEISTYRDSSEGLGQVKKFLHSSVLINKVSSGKPYSNCINSYRVIEDSADKVFKKLDGFKNCEFPLMRTASDITIQSVSKSEINNAIKLDSSKPKLENKVGRVLCVDVMDRKALEEALKSSRDSVKKAEFSPKHPTTSMVDRLRRWNSIDNSSPVPFSSHQTSSDSTNLLSAAVKGDANSLTDVESEKNGTEASVLRQSMTVAGVNNKSGCDNSCVESLAVGFSQCPEETQLSGSVIKNEQLDKKECSVDSKLPDVPSVEPLGIPDSSACNTSILKSECKVTLKIDVDSPEGTPKGDHGNGQGGEDSGIESMDALSEKSPNHNDQSPNRREDKECDIYSMKCKDSYDQSVQQPKENKVPATLKESTVDSGQSKSCQSLESSFSGKENPAITDINVLASETKLGENICSEQSTNSKIPFAEAASILTTCTETVSQSLSNINNEPCVKSAINPKNDSRIKSPIPDPITSIAPLPKLVQDTNIVISAPNIENCSVANTPVSLTTATIANSSIKLQKYQTSTSSITTNTQSVISGGVSNITLANKVIANAKPSLLAITLTRPPGSGKINSQYAASIAKNLDMQPTDESPVHPFSPKPPTDKIIPDVVPSSNHVSSISNSSKNNPTMIILATTTNPTSGTNSPPINSKIVSVKPSSQAISASINPPVGKAFRLVALPGINNVVAPASSPIRGQLVTLKPVMGVSTPVSSIKQPASVPPTQEFSPIAQSGISTSVSEGELDDLDFVGFSSAKKTEELKEKTTVPVSGEPSVPLMSPTEEEPTPMRVQPPLYTYGNKERKKESESDVEDKEKDPASVEDVSTEKETTEEDIPVKLKEKTLDALTIEIPGMEILHDDKRLTRATRQSARLSSPKVNNTSGDLSPHPDKKITPVAVTINKSIVRSSPSPIPRNTKRRRHESESSNASSVSEDLQESSSKTRRRKTTARDELLKGRATKFKEAEQEKLKAESSDEDTGPLETVSIINSISAEDALSAPKMVIAREKEAINLRENLRRASRQKSQHEREETGESAEGKVASKGVAPKVVSSVKAKKENVDQSELEASRRKTRSTASNVSEDVPNKRRRQSKEK